MKIPLKYPEETMTCLVQRRTRFGNPIYFNLAHLVAFQKAGLDVDDIKEKDYLPLVYLMERSYAEELLDFNPTNDTFYRKWCKAIPVDDLLGKTVDCNTYIVDSFNCFVKGKSEKGEVVSSMPSGFGFPLEMAEFLMGEYKMSFLSAMETPVARTFGLMNCYRMRQGGKNGAPDYYERIYNKEMEEWLSRFKKADKEMM